MEKLLTPAEVADALRVSKKTITDWIYHKRIKSVKVGSLVRFRQADIDAFLTPAEPRQPTIKPKSIKRRGRPRKASEHAHSELIRSVMEEVYNNNQVFSGPAEGVN